MCKAALRYDGGPCLQRRPHQAEIDHLGTARSPAYHDGPATNDCLEKFIQTRGVNERCLLGRPAYPGGATSARESSRLSHGLRRGNARDG